MGRWLIGWWCTLMLAGCGRFGFGALDLPDHDGGGDAPGDGTSGVACPAFAVFCEDFESGDLSRWTRTNLVGPSTMEVNGTRVRTGAFSLDTASSPSPTPSAASTRIAIPPRSTGTLAVRQWINLATPLVNFDLLIDLTGAAGDYTTVGGDLAGNWASTEGRAGGGTAVDRLSGVPGPPIDTWVCIELVFTFLPPSGAQIQVFVDGTSVLDVPGSAPSPTYFEVGVGAVRSDQIGFHVFTDDVVIAEQRIGCD